MAGRVHLRQRLKSFAYAFRGIGEMLQTESHARIHGVATLLVVLLGLVLRVDRLEWLALVLTIALVFGLEAVNTAFEALCDVASPDYHPQVRRAKDVAAGAVLIAAIAAVIVAALIFGHRLFG